MGALLKLNLAAPMTRAALPLALHGDPWAAAPEDKRREAELRAVFISPWQAWGGSANVAAERLHWDAQAAKLPQSAQNAVALLGSVPSVPTIKRWLLAFAKEGKLGLLDGRSGKQRLPQEWHHMAAAIYNKGSKPSYAAVAKELQAAGYPDAVEHRVRSYLQALPTRLGQHGIARVGPALHRLTLQKFQARHTDNIRAGDAYVGDGHTVDVYLAHPITGRIYRPELSFFMDLKSRMPVGWWLGDSETAVDTLRALGSAMARFDHVPPMLYLDHGAGYRARLMTADNVGFAAQMGIDITAAHPGNPHGKGWVESFFRTLRDEHDKLFAGGSFYCGDDMAPEINRRLSVEVNAGRRKLPSVWEYTQSLTAFLERIANRPMDALDGKTRAQVWEESFVRIPTVFPVAELIRPMTTATVRRQTVTLHKRTYYLPALIDWQGKQVRVRYDLHHDSHVWLYDERNQLIGQADLTHKVAALPDSRVEEARMVAEAKAVQRKEQDIAEIRRRNAKTVDAATQFSDIAALTFAPSPALPAALATEEVPDINLLDWRPE